MIAIPIIVVDPFDVALTTASSIDFVPFEKFSHSKTPAGPFQTIVLALSITGENSFMLAGPISKPYNLPIKISQKEIKYNHLVIRYTSCKITCDKWGAFC